MLLKAFNQSLIEDRERTYLTAASTAADTAITVSDTDLAPAATSSNTWADNDYMIIGEIGHEGTEVIQVNGAVTSATSITVDREGQAGGLRHNHPIGTAVYRVDYNQVQFLRSATDDSGSAVQQALINLQPDDEFTRYEDTSNTTGYGFVRFYNAATGALSSYSDGVNYTQTGDSSSRDPRTLWSLIKKVRQLLDETESNSKLTDAMVTEALNDKQREIAHIRLWSFYEGEKSFSLIANQFAYDIPSSVQIVHGITSDTQPLAWMNRTDWEIRHWDTDQSTADPSHYSIWNRQIKIHPRPSAASSTTTLNGAITSSDTTITVASASAFHRGDYYRFIIDSEVIYATASTSTTFTGALRGKEGTTAASHLNAATVTERDIVYTAHVEPTDLVSTQDRTDVPEPDVLTYGAAVDLAPLVGKEQLIGFLEGKYVRRIKELKDKYSSKQTQEFGRIKDITERMSAIAQYMDPNRFPKSINT